ncbi:MAG: hypothetical protein GF341_10730 [candidate division Zixibacteria bacterium]|nr:hypothetical protein [candidate division Zixibacteria bacterium]
MRVLLIRYSSLGDVVLTSAVPRAIRRVSPDAAITVLTKQSLVPIVEHFDTDVSVVGVTDDRALGESIRQLRSQKFDAIIDLHASIRSVIVSHALYAKQRERIAKETRRRRRMVKDKHGLDHPLSVVSNYCNASCRVFTDLTECEPKLRLNAGEHAAAKRLHEQHPHALGIGWGARWPTKTVPASLWKAVLAELDLEDIKSVRLFGLADHRQAMQTFAHEVAGEHPDIRFEIHAGLSYADVMVHLYSCAAYLGSDSGVMHLAAALGVPTVAVFGPTHPSLGFAPVGEHTRTIHSGIWCSPCHKHGSAPCFRERRFCFEDLDPTTIANAIHDLTSLRRNTT